MHLQGLAAAGAYCAPSLEDLPVLEPEQRLPLDHLDDRLAALEPLGERLGHPSPSAWGSCAGRPPSQVVGTEDRVIPPDTQRHRSTSVN